MVREDPAMPTQLEISLVDVQKFSALARAIIDRRLAQIPESSRPEFWSIVAKVYGRGLPRHAVTADLLQTPPEVADAIKEPANSRPPNRSDRVMVVAGR